MIQSRRRWRRKRYETKTQRQDAHILQVLHTNSLLLIQSPIARALRDTVLHAKQPFQCRSKLEPYAQTRKTLSFLSERVLNQDNAKDWLSRSKTNKDTLPFLPLFGRGVKRIETMDKEKHNEALVVLIKGEFVLLLWLSSKLYQARNHLEGVNFFSKEKKRKAESSSTAQSHSQNASFKAEKNFNEDITAQTDSRIHSKHTHQYSHLHSLQLHSTSSPTTLSNVHRQNASGIRAYHRR